jgi:hypothetical protein
LAREGAFADQLPDDELVHKCLRRYAGQLQDVQQKMFLFTRSSLIIPAQVLILFFLAQQKYNTLCLMAQARRGGFSFVALLSRQWFTLFFSAPTLVIVRVRRSEQFRYLQSLFCAGIL